LQLIAVTTLRQKNYKGFRFDMGKPRKSRGRQIDGIFLLNKSSGMTSNAALQRAKWLFAAAKAGHTGSLDPMATGVLPLCFGEATKFSQYLLNADKAYRCTMRFGIRTNTSDAEGQIVSDNPGFALTQNEVESALARFVGQIEQVPSMFSAIKHQGQPLYKLAREGIEIERAARPVTVYELNLTAFRSGEYPEADVEARVSKGTYIRTLAEDVGNVIGCGAHISRLHRSQAGPFHESDCVSLEQLETTRGEGFAELLDHFLLPVETAIDHLQTVTMQPASGFYFRQGQPVLEVGALQTTAVGEMVRVVLDNGEFLGIAEIQMDGRIAPRKLMQHNSLQQSITSTVNMHG
jgi:tRNA pseudouridine55 synthase